jgi:hypothetical protein
MIRMMWLACRASLGQFSDEFAVRGKDHQGNEFSLFTSRNFVRAEQEPRADQDVPAWLKVAVLDRSGSLRLVQLPGQAFEYGSTITVGEDQLEDSPSTQFA